MSRSMSAVRPCPCSSVAITWRSAASSGQMVAERQLDGHQPAVQQHERPARAVHLVVHPQPVDRGVSRGCLAHDEHPPRSTGRRGAGRLIACCGSPRVTPASSSGKRCSATAASASGRGSSWSRGCGRSRWRPGSAGAFRALLYDAGRPLSGWARDLLRDVPARPGGDGARACWPSWARRREGAPELVAVVEMPDDDLDRITAGPRFLGVVLDRPASPGNVGSIIRSADAFGADGVIVTGHAADVYDPRAVRASTGSLFARPVVRCPSHREVIAWVEARARGRLSRRPGRRRRARRDERLRRRPHPAGPAPGRQRDRRPDRRLARPVRPDRPHPHHRRRQLPQRRQRRHRDPLRDNPPAHKQSA